MSESNLAKPGDVHWTKCDLISAAGPGIGILALIHELNIYEDMYSPTLHGSALIVDTHDLITRFPIIGEEKLRVSFSTPSGGSFSQTFRIYKAENRTIDMNRQVYNVLFYSEEAAESATKQWSVQFKGNGDVIVKDIISRMGSKKQVESEATGNLLEFIPAFWHPFKCIDYVAKNTIYPKPDKQFGDYVFFENAKGYVFKSLSTIKERYHKKKFYYDHYRPKVDYLAEKSYERQMSSVIDLRFITTGNWLQREQQQAYSHFCYIHDLLYKTIDYAKYELENIYANVKHVGGKVIGVEKDGEVLVSESPDTLTHWLMGGLPPGMDEQYRTDHWYTYNYMFDDLKQDFSGKAFLSRKPMLALNEFIKLDIDIWGTTELTVGDTIWLTLGKHTSSRTEASFDPKDLDDPVLSGKYLITAIAHRLSPGQHLMTLQIVKDSTGVDLKSHAAIEIMKMTSETEKPNTTIV